MVYPALKKNKSVLSDVGVSPGEIWHHFGQIAGQTNFRCTLTFTLHHHGVEGSEPDLVTSLVPQRPPRSQPFFPQATSAGFRETQ